MVMASSSPWLPMLVVAGMPFIWAIGCGEPTRTTNGQAGAAGGAAGRQPAGGDAGGGGRATAGSGAASGSRAIGGAGGAQNATGGEGARGGGSGASEAGSGGEGGLGEAGGAPTALGCESLPPPRTFAAALFAKGDDPSADPECTSVLNPERGFFRFRDLRSLDDVGGLRDDGYSLIYGRVLLDDYRERDLDADLLETLAESFATARAAGLKVLPRFYYADDGSSPDAPVERVLGHILQLTPLLEDSSSVIAALHAGFVGAWGEWHGSTNDLTAPETRKTIFDALLAALPASRMVLARRPSHKLAAYGGPLDEASAYQGDALGRIGHLNDCFLASDDDMGTYQESGEKAYAAADSAFAAVGGETCAVNPPRSACDSAEDELALHHFSFLNADYHPDVLAAWRADGCFERIRCRLGYRFALLAFSTPERASAGAEFSLFLSLFNDGYARAYNPRGASLILDGPATLALDLELELRQFAPGEAGERCLKVDLPATLPAGSYRVGLRFPDPDEPDDARFAVRLASGVTWDDESGVNWLDADVMIQEP